MIVGNPSVFAIESGITRAYEHVSFRGLGFFAIHAGGRSYGRRTPESTMLACSYDEVEKRITRRHATSFGAESDGGKIADAFRTALYSDTPQENYFGLPVSAFSDMINAKHIMWAPDGDEAFDDGSYVLHFDVEDRVRLIAFQCGQGYPHDPGTIRDVWLPADDFYRTLQHWHDVFGAEWESMPKVKLAIEQE
jgi:hypothetical protein